MASTTSFNWETPDDTDLVKDGAAAIRTLGNSIDTSMTDLLGGTTGQLLSKTSDTDMDFTWSAPASSGGMTLISTTAITATSAVDLTSIPQTYKTLLVIVDGAFENSGSAQTLTFNNQTSLYSHAYIQAANSNTVIVNTSTSAISLMGSLRFVAGSGSGSIAITIPNYASTTMAKNVTWSAYGGNGATGGFGGVGAIAAITSVKITWAGTPSAQGNVYLYGVE